MKTAFSFWQDRIAPVFDTSSQIRLVTSVGRQIKEEALLELPDDDGFGKVDGLLAQEIGTLVCGAISRPLQERFESAGVRVMPFIAGDLTQVVRAYYDGMLRGAAFTMPGCCGRRRMRCGYGGGYGGRGRGRLR